MIPLDAIDAVSVRVPRCTLRLGAMLQTLHALTIAEQPYAYLLATGPRQARTRIAASDPRFVTSA